MLDLLAVRLMCRLFSPFHHFQQSDDLAKCADCTVPCCQSASKGDLGHTGTLVLFTAPHAASPDVIGLPSPACPKASSQVNVSGLTPALPMASPPSMSGQARFLGSPYTFSNPCSSGDTARRAWPLPS